MFLCDNTHASKRVPDYSRGRIIGHALDGLDGATIAKLEHRPKTTVRSIMSAIFARTANYNLLNVHLVITYHLISLSAPLSLPNRPEQTHQTIELTTSIRSSLTGFPAMMPFLCFPSQCLSWSPVPHFHPGLSDLQLVSAQGTRSLVRPIEERRRDLP